MTCIRPPGPVVETGLSPCERKPYLPVLEPPCRPHPGQEGFGLLFAPTREGGTWGSGGETQQSLEGHRGMGVEVVGGPPSLLWEAGNPETGLRWQLPHKQGPAVGSPTLPHLGDPQGPLQPLPWMPLTSGWDGRLAPQPRWPQACSEATCPAQRGAGEVRGINNQTPPTLGVPGLRAAGGAGRPPLAPLLPSRPSRVQLACPAPTVPLARAGYRARGKGASPGSGPYHALTNRQVRGTGGPACPGSPVDHLSLCCSGCAWGRGEP